MPHRLYPSVAQRARHLCEYCLASERAFNLEFEVEHIVPERDGGQDELDNLALACRACNVHKGATTRAQDPQTRETTLLFNPRIDDWSEHFQLRLDTFEIEGLTPTGRATVRRLGMNRLIAVRARRLWMTRLFLPH
ncbi:MAG TPA: HNH endonuclease signature motif containing protein [Chloroflexota bacterium]|jgi:hypothetical protein